MKIAVLSRSRALYSTARLIEAAESKGHEVEVVDYLRCFINISPAQPTVFYSGRPLNDFDAVIPRIGASNTFYGTAVVRQFEMMGKFTVNSSISISRSRDKLRSLQILSRRGVRLPVTGFAHSAKDVTALIDSLGGAPLVIKLLEGTQGLGVVLTETRKATESVIEAFRGSNVQILIQQFIKEAGGEDLRCFVIGDRVVASMKRKAPEGEFRANVHRGGSVSKVKITKEERAIAVQAAKEMGLHIAGVDLLRSKDGPMVLEVNSSPGLEGIEKASKVDVASSIISFIEKNLDKGKKKAKKLQV
jgi:ribosomal protein S6--L-glutamate ligase